MQHVQLKVMLLLCVLLNVLACSCRQDAKVCLTSVGFLYMHLALVSKHVHYHYSYHDCDYYCHSYHY